MIAEGKGGAVRDQSDGAANSSQAPEEELLASSLDLRPAIAALKIAALANATDGDRRVLASRRPTRLDIASRLRVLE